MPMTARDAQAATYLAQRLREEKQGAATWNEAGTHAKVSELVGQNLEISLERIFRHAADPKAQTPGAIHRPFTPPAASEKPPPVRKKTRDVQCPRCGGFRGECPCRATDGREVEWVDESPAHPRSPNLEARLAAVLAAKGRTQ